MVLIFKCQMNHVVLFLISAKRTRGTDKPDSINTYRISLTDYREISLGESVILGSVKHRYGDPAEVLMKKSFDLALHYMGYK